MYPSITLIYPASRFLFASERLGSSTFTSGMGFGGYTGNVSVAAVAAGATTASTPPTPSNPHDPTTLTLDPTVAQHLKRTSKRDAITRTKALV